MTSKQKSKFIIKPQKNYAKVIIYFGLLLLSIFYRWAILSRVGILPKDICSSQVMKNYLKQGGDPNAWLNTFSYSAPLVHCFTNVEDIKDINLFIQKGGNLNYVYWGGHTIWSEVEKPESALILFKYLRHAENLGDKEKQKLKLLLLSKSLKITILLLENGADINNT
ncbi:MAG: hypothetical protein AAGF83_15605, partial [Cyanobacteria bacterium P01_G01_bin.67]